MGNSNSTEGNNLVTSYQYTQQQKQQVPEQKSESSNSDTINQVENPASSSSSSQKPQSSTTEPTINTESTHSYHWSPKEPSIQEDNVPVITTTNTEPIPMKEADNNEQPATATQAVPVSTGKSGWVSSTGAASPWYGSLGSSVSSSHHRTSISGPYYRTRGMSVTRDPENDEDLMNILSNTANTSATASTTTPDTQKQSTTSSVIQPKAASNEGVPTIITWTQGGNNVYITGTFNGWKHKIKLIKSVHDFSAVLELPPGTHRLKFIVDDEWKCSNDMETATDPDGNLVNYLQVMDEEDEQGHNDEFGDLSTVSSSGSLDESKKYSSTIPPELLQLASLNEQQKEDHDKKKALLEREKKQPQPPGLPPHLEKVLLNSQTVSEEDNSVLHEPNHVTLNHLYACSIKDNVMALATTSRYRKKYITTMYYRPVFPKN